MSVKRERRLLAAAHRMETNYQRNYNSNLFAVLNCTEYLLKA